MSTRTNAPSLTPRERFIATLERRPLTGRVPHFELAFFLTMEAFGRVHPGHRSYHQWYQMSENERQLHRKEMAGVYIAIAERFEHSAIYLVPNPGRDEEETKRLIDLVREESGDRYFVMVPGDATFGVPNGSDMVEFSYRMADDPKELKCEAARRVNKQLEQAERLRKHGGLDGFAMCADYCLNQGPFMSPAQFGEFVSPYLTELLRGYREMGYYSIKHTDGNIMPIIEQLIDAGPDALHSLDPQGSVDIAEVKRMYGDRVCLVGNVNCGLMDTGSEEEVIESARYALKHGMPGGGYIFSTSNCIYTGMDLSRYELILEIWRQEGNYAPELSPTHIP